jgi:hypothetical protein
VLKIHSRTSTSKHRLLRLTCRKSAFDQSRVQSSATQIYFGQHPHADVSAGGPPGLGVDVIKLHLQVHDPLPRHAVPCGSQSSCVAPVQPFELNRPQFVSSGGNIEIVSPRTSPMGAASTPSSSASAATPPNTI